MSAQRHWAEHLRLSHHGATFIALEEGVRLHPYADSQGWATAGVGHLIVPMHRGVTAHDRQTWTFRSAAEAVNYFRDHDIRPYEQAVHRALGQSSITQAQFDACCSLAFNIGVGGFERSQVAHLIRQGRLRAAGNAFLGWAHPSELRGRRLRERAVFLRGHW